MTHNNTIELEFLGRNYEFNCPPNQKEKLTTAAKMLELIMQNIKNNTNADRESIMLMAALNLSFDLHASCSENNTFDQTINELQAEITALNQRVELLLENIGVATS